MRIENNDDNDYSDDSDGKGEDAKEKSNGWRKRRALLAQSQICIHSVNRKPKIVTVIY